jgi:uncharacterized protein (DUF111 family)
MTPNDDKIPSDASRVSLALLQADLDDESPEVLAAVAEKLLALGARDVVRLPVIMKKGRLGTRIEVLAEPTDVERFAAILLRETSTLGLRWWPVERVGLARRIAEIDVDSTRVRVKVALADGEPLKAKAEADDVKGDVRLARRAERRVLGD